MGWTRRLIGGIFLVATAVELALAEGISAFTGLAFLAALAPVFIVTGLSWTFVGALASGFGRLAPPLTTSSGYTFSPGMAPSLASEYYISWTGAERVAKKSLRSLEEDSPFMTAAVLYGLAVFAIGWWLVA